MSDGWELSPVGDVLEDGVAKNFGELSRDLRVAALSGVVVSVRLQPSAAFRLSELIGEGVRDGG